MKRLTILFLCSIQLIKAANYYISPNGNDLNDGRSPQSAWKTINKVQQSMSNSLFVSGDSILFQSNGIYRGSLQFNATISKIVIGKYGTGRKPVISGSAVSYSSWSSVVVNGKSAYRTKCAESIKHLILNNTHLTIARMPDTGFYTMTKNGVQLGVPKIVAAEFSAHPSWKGATARIRVGNDAYNNRVISSISGDTAILTAGDLTFVPKSGWGYYVDNQLAFLDTYGEWFLDDPKDSLYVIPPKGVNMNTASFEGLCYSFGIALSAGNKNVVIRDIEFDNQKDNAIQGTDMDHLTITNCIFRNQGDGGIDLVGVPTQNCIIANNEFYDIFSTSISIRCNDGSIHHNIIKRNFLTGGYGPDNDFSSSMGLFVSGNRNKIRYNIIDSVGYHGMYTLSFKDSIEYNVIRNCGLVKNDLGGIYSWENWNTDTLRGSNAYIDHNIVYNIFGNLDGTTGSWGGGEGIYLDDGCWRYKITNNTVYNTAGKGIFIQSCQYTTVKGNTVYNCQNAPAIGIHSKTKAEAPFVIGTVVDNNTFINLKNSLPCFNLSAVDGYIRQGVYDHNYYFNPYNEYPFTSQYGNNQPKNFTLTQWQIVDTSDASSKSAFLWHIGYDHIQFTSANLKPNPDFTSDYSNYNTGGWTNSTRTYISSNSPLNNGCIKVSKTASGNFYVEAKDLPALEKDSLYYIGFSALCDVANSNISLSFSRQSTPYNIYNAFKKSFPIGTQRRDYAYIVKNDANYGDLTMIQFIMSNEASFFYLDNVVVRKVSAKAVQTTDQNHLWVNESQSPMVVDLNGVSYLNMDSVPVKGNITVPPYSSVFLIRDDNQPVAKCRNATAYLDEYGMAKIDTGMINNNSYSGNFNLESLSLSKYTFNCSESGEQSITMFVRNKGLFTGSCKSKVMVLDTISPKALCKSDTAFLNNGSVSIDSSFINNKSIDNCAIKNMKLSSYDFNANNLGWNKVVMTVIDQSGNSSSCIGDLLISQKNTALSSEDIHYSIYPTILAAPYLITVISPSELSGDIEFILYGLKGEVVLNQKLLNSPEQIVLQNLPAGIYLSVIKSEKEIKLSKKIIIE